MINDLRTDAVMSLISRLEENQLCQVFLGLVLKDTPEDWRARMETLVSVCVPRDQPELISVLSSLISLPNLLG